MRGTAQTLFAGSLLELMLTLMALWTGGSSLLTHYSRTTAQLGNTATSLCLLKLEAFADTAAFAKCSLRGEEESTSYGAPVEPEDLSGHRRHGHMITDIINLPAKGHLKERYVTTGKDGTFRFWQAKVWLQNLIACSASLSVAVAHGILLLMQYQQTVSHML